MWIWFKRVLLGTLLERFAEHGIAVDASTLAMSFDEDSVFRFPALDNKLRFVGEARASLVREVPDAAWTALERDLQRAWPDLVEQMQRFPVPDRLTVTRNVLTVERGDGAVVLRFDLVAD